MSFFLLNLQLEVDVTPVVSKHLHESINNSHFFNGTKKKTVRARATSYFISTERECAKYIILCRKYKRYKFKLQYKVQ